MIGIIPPGELVQLGIVQAVPIVAAPWFDNRQTRRLAHAYLARSRQVVRKATMAKRAKRSIQIAPDGNSSPMDKEGKTMATRAVLYARVSGDDTRNESRNLRGQLDMCREYALRRGWHIVDELAEDDRGASGASLELPQLNKSLDMARAREYDVVIVREIDRFSRMLAKQLIGLDQAETDLDARQQIVEKLDARGVLAVEGEEQVIYLQCMLGGEPSRVVLPLRHGPTTVESVALARPASGRGAIRREEIITEHGQRETTNRKPVAHTLRYHSVALEAA